MLNSSEEIRSYYDERVSGKMRDFIHANPRIEAAVELIGAWAPANPGRILEIGCGVGATCWRMAKAWPDAEVIGIDISAASVDLARNCFKRPNLAYHAASASEIAVTGHFDLVVMMDVYEHIACEDRNNLHQTIRKILADDSRAIFSIPTPLLQARGRLQTPDAMQPVDEDISILDIAMLAAHTETRLLYFRELGIWEYGDYAHFVLGRYCELSPVKLRNANVTGLSAIKTLVRQMLGRGHSQTGLRNYLGMDVLNGQNQVSGLRVSKAERAKLAAHLAATRSRK